MDLADDKARADVEDNFRKTIGQLIGGAAVLVGAGFAYLQFQQQQTSAHDLLISNQVAKGFELLGNKEKDISQRLGGIYALEGVMNTSKEYYQPVLEALCAFIRDRAAETSEGAVASDIRAALKVIGRRAVLGEAVPDLRKIRLPEADLSDVKLLGADLSEADLSDGNLSVANLSDANLRNANLRGANLVGAYLSGANLNGANLSAAHLHWAHLSSVNLSDADLSDTDLSQAVLEDADLTGANLHNTNLSGPWLSRAKLSKVKGLIQEQLDKTCGTDVKLDPPLTIKPCR